VAPDIREDRIVDADREILCAFPGGFLPGGSDFGSEVVRDVIRALSVSVSIAQLRRGDSVRSLGARLRLGGSFHHENCTAGPAVAILGVRAAVEGLPHLGHSYCFRFGSNMAVALQAILLYRRQESQQTLTPWRLRLPSFLGVGTERKRMPASPCQISK
jgi:hypothetical protein